MAWLAIYGGENISINEKFLSRKKESCASHFVRRRGILLVLEIALRRIW
jgi:hypothetical protein